MGRASIKLEYLTRCFTFFSNKISVSTPCTEYQLFQSAVVKVTQWVLSSKKSSFKSSLFSFSKVHSPFKDLVQYLASAEYT